MEQKASELDAALRPLRVKIPDDVLVDAEIHLKAARWVLRLDEFYSKKSVEQTLAVLDSGLERALKIAVKDSKWMVQPGHVTRAYRSRVDGSVQPYALTLPQDFNTAWPPNWLEVVLHGRVPLSLRLAFSIRMTARSRRRIPAIRSSNWTFLDVATTHTGGPAKPTFGKRSKASRSATASIRNGLFCAAFPWVAPARGILGCTSQTSGRRKRQAPVSSRRKCMGSDESTAVRSYL